MRSRDTIIGIIGGMGPEATAQFYLKLIANTPVSRDQDHFRVLIDSNPKIPDRTAAILGIGESPVPAIVETAQNLEKMGVNIGCLPCITSHYFYEAVQARVGFEIIHAIKALHDALQVLYPDVKRVGILATTGTCNTKLYDKYLLNYELVYPDSTTQAQKVMAAIYGPEGIKAGFHGVKPLGLLRSAANQLVAQGAQVIIAGCTEVPLVLKQEHLDVPLLDPMEIVIDVLIYGSAIEKMAYKKGQACDI